MIDGGDGVKGAAAVLFDLDGTLTRPILDFGAIREELGVSATASILAEVEEAERAEPARGKHMRAILDRHELEAAKATQPNEGALELLTRLDERSLPWAVVTRNAKTPARLTLACLGYPNAILVSREDAPPKPNPAPIHLACHHLGLMASETWFVGDYLDDISAGKAAGCAGTILITNGRAPAFDCEPTLLVTSLCDLHHRV